MRRRRKKKWHSYLAFHLVIQQKFVYTTQPHLLQPDIGLADRPHTRTGNWSWFIVETPSSSRRERERCTQRFARDFRPTPPPPPSTSSFCTFRRLSLALFIFLRCLTYLRASTLPLHDCRSVPMPIFIKHWFFPLCGEGGGRRPENFLSEHCWAIPRKMRNWEKLDLLFFIIFQNLASLNLECFFSRKHCLRRHLKMPTFCEIINDLGWNCSRQVSSFCRVRSLSTPHQRHPKNV